MNGKPFEVWSFLMLKGGVRKTTSAMFIAEALVRSEKFPVVLAVDADAGTQGMTEWIGRIVASGDDPPFGLVQWNPRMGEPLINFVYRQAKEHEPDYVILDLGSEFPDQVKLASMISDRMIMPVGAEPAEVARLAETVACVRGTAVVEPMVLLTRVPKPHQGLALVVRELLEGSHYRVLETEIPQHRETYASVYGQAIGDLGAYHELLPALLCPPGTWHAAPVGVNDGR